MYFFQTPKEEFDLLNELESNTTFLNTRQSPGVIDTAWTLALGRLYLQILYYMYTVSENY